MMNNLTILLPTNLGQDHICITKEYKGRTRFLSSYSWRLSFKTDWWRIQSYKLEKNASITDCRNYLTRTFQKYSGLHIGEATTVLSSSFIDSLKCEITHLFRKQKIEWQTEESLTSKTLLGKWNILWLKNKKNCRPN